MENVTEFAVTYFPPHSRRLLDMPKNSNVDDDLFDEIILSRLTMMELAAWLDALPEKRVRRKCVASIDRLLPNAVINDLWDINRFLARHGPSMMVAIAQVEALTWKRRLGIADTEDYCEAVRVMDAGLVNTEAIKEELMKCEA